MFSRGRTLIFASLVVVGVIALASSLELAMAGKKDGTSGLPPGKHAANNLEDRPDPGNDAE